MKIHFVSIGGSVMHQLAIALKRKGYEVTGSDDEIFEPARGNLEREGIMPQSIGWNPAHISVSLDAVILGMHARKDNPELLTAQELKLPIFSFPEYIFRESKDKKRVVVGGSHGKTTTTSMIMHVLRAAAHPFDYLVGARLDGFDQSVNITDAPLIVCEGDEYPASAIERKPKFHFLFPHIAILTGIAWDHINVFPTFENYLEQFTLFINKIEKQGLLIYNVTDPVLKDLVENHTRKDLRLIPYQVPEHQIEFGITRVTIDNSQSELKVFGNHNLMNLQAAWLVCKELGVTAEVFANAMSSFTGASKRLELLARNEDVVFYRDFAHAPSKVKATIEAVKQQFPDKKFIAVLELHTYSSLNEKFMQEYKGVMNDADAAAVFYSQHALGIKKLPLLPKSAVKAGFDKQDLEVFNKREELEDWLKQQEFKNAVVVFMSSGNYDGFDNQSFAKAICGQNL
ncbi:MAG: peptidoglycan synthetase [Flavisolibacter sp.]|jgi:UDP-N-acetylmuramate: L-alanyl-gamma-D-glutamyl-meso-diaminopimelate ligase|nr:peptidoglycan synthetase [Flavisolibacter sp.]